MNSLTEPEFAVLDELYFISSYVDLLDHITMDEILFRTALTGLLEKKFIVQMKYNDELKNFEELEPADLSSLENSSFVASREGLLIHNSRN